MACVKTFPNGLRLVLERRPRARRTAIVIGFARGARDESRRFSGECHLIEHLVTERYPVKDDIVREMDRIGADHNASTSEDTTMFYCTVPGRWTQWGLNLLIDLILHPEFTPTDVALEREVVLEELRGYQDTVVDELERFRSGTLFYGHPLSKSILGQPSSLRRVTHKRIRQVWERLLDPQLTVVTVVGQFDRSRVCALVRDRLGGLQEPANPFPARRIVRPNPNGHRCLLRYGSYGLLKQVNFHWTYRIPGYRSRDRFALTLLADIIGGRWSSPIYLELRRRGLVYDMDTDIWFHPEGGYLTIDGASGRRSGTTEKARQKFFATLEVIDSFLKNFRDGGISSSEVDLARRSVMTQMQRTHDDVERAARSFTAQMCCYGFLLDLPRFWNRIRRVRRADVVRAARKYLIPERSLFCAVGPLTRSDRERLHAMFPAKRRRRS